MLDFSMMSHHTALTLGFDSRKVIFSSRPPWLKTFLRKCNLLDQIATKEA